MFLYLKALKIAKITSLKVCQRLIHKGRVCRFQKDEIQNDILRDHEFIVQFIYDYRT